MERIEKSDFGTIKVNKKVLADIVTMVLSQMQDVSLVPVPFVRKLGYYFGKDNIDGIHVKFDEKSDVHIDIHVFVRYGIHVPDVAQEIQEKIKAAIHHALDIQLKSVNINIEGIDRGEK